MASEAHECASTTWGSPEAPKTAVLIHGLASSSQTWLDVAPDLVKKGDGRIHSQVISCTDDFEAITS